MKKYIEPNVEIISFKMEAITNSDGTGTGTGTIIPGPGGGEVAPD